MGSVSSANSALTSMLQTIGSVDSPVLSSSSVISSLESAPPQDIIEISTAATEMSGLDDEFGMTPTSSSTETQATDLSNVLSSLSSSQNTEASSSNATNASTAQQLATYEASVQAADTQTLFGTGTTTGLSQPVFG